MSGYQIFWVYFAVAVFIYIGLLLSGDSVKQYFRQFAFTDEDKEDARLMAMYWPLIGVIVSLLWPFVIIGLVIESMSWLVKK